MAHKKAGGSSRNGRDSHAQRLGVDSHSKYYLKNTLINPAATSGSTVMP